MEQLSLKEIANAIGAECESDEMVTSVCTDTRKIEKGCLFIAIEGERFNAHTFVQQACDKGAVAVVCHEKVICSGTVLMVENTSKAYLDLAGYYRSKFDIPLIGLTGSVGKTTTKEFVALVMSKKYKTLKTLANFNNDIGMPSTLLRLDSSYGAAVIEMGMNHFGEIHNLVTRSKPTMGIITNIGISHIENLGSRDGILKAKLEILDGMAVNAPLLLNGDDDKLVSVKSEGRKIYHFGIKNKNCEFLADNIVSGTNSTAFDIIYPDGKIKAEIPTIGVHNVMNGLVGFAAGYLNAVKAEDAVSALAEYAPSGMRQKVVNLADFTVIEDCYNASPDSMKASIGTLAELPAKKRIAVLGDMLELGKFTESAHREIGKYTAEKNIDVVFGFGESARFYCDEAEKNGVKKVACFSDKMELLDAVCAENENGSAILFKGSHAMHLEETIKSLYERNGINE